MRPTLSTRIRALLAAFVQDEKSRHKDKTPDLGVALVLFTVFQGHQGCPTRSEFINAYADENSLRWVMWWQRSGTKPESRPVFQATQVSREICMFQMTVVDIVIAEVATTLKEIESTNCKLNQRLESLQAQWRDRKSSIDDWASYYDCIGADKPAFRSESDWIADCVNRAAAKGPKYGGAKGDGKGKGSGKAGGKGGYKSGGKGWGGR